MKTKLLSLILALALLAGCTSAPTPAPTVPATATLPPTATATAEPSPTPTATPVPLPMEIPPADAVYPSSIEDRVILPEQIQAMKDAFLKIADDPAIQPKVDLIQKNLLAIAEKDGIQSPTVTGYVDGGRWGMVVSDVKGTTYRLLSTPPPVWTTLEGLQEYQELTFAVDPNLYRFLPLDQPITIPEENLVQRKVDQRGFDYFEISDPSSEDVLTWSSGVDDFWQNIFNISGSGFYDVKPVPEGFRVLNNKWVMVFRESDGTKGFLDQQYVLQKKNRPEWSNVKDAGASQELSSDIFEPENFRLVPMIYPGIPEEAEFALVNQEGWLVSAFIEPSGEVVAWYDTNDGQYRTADGNKLEIVYTPFEPGTTTWEDCQKNVIPSPWDNPEQYQAAIEKIHTFDQKYEWEKDLSSYATGIVTQMPGVPGELELHEIQYDKHNSNVQIGFCGFLENPYGDTLAVYSIPISFPTSPGRINRVSYSTSTILVAISENELKYLFNNLYGENSEEAQESILQLSSKNITSRFGDSTDPRWYRFVVAFVSSQHPIVSDIPELQSLKDIFNKNYADGIQQLLEKALMGEATQDEITKLKNSIFPVWRLYPQ